MSSSKVGQSPVIPDLAVSVREFILKQFPLARHHQIKDSDPLLESGILDSLGVLDVVAFLEAEFSIVAADDDLSPENFQTIERIAAYVRSKI
jgi:acyl carrier protein